VFALKRLIIQLGVLLLILEGTVSEGKEFTAVSIERSKNDWCYCTVEGGKFRGAGGPDNLSEILEIFHHWEQS